MTPPLRVLIVEGSALLARRWSDELQKCGMSVDVVRSETDATHALFLHGYDVIVLDVDRCNGSALAIADLAAFRAPRVPVISVSRGQRYRSGAVFGLMSNACIEIGPSTPCRDLSALVEHYGRHPV